MLAALDVSRLWSSAIRILLIDHILSMGIDTATPTGRLMLNLLASISQFEREVMLERQREGVAKAKSEGKSKQG